MRHYKRESLANCKKHESKLATSWLDAVHQLAVLLGAASCVAAWSKMMSFDKTTLLCQGLEGRASVCYEALSRWARLAKTVSAQDVLSQISARDLQTKFGKSNGASFSTMTVSRRPSLHIHHILLLFPISMPSSRLMQPWISEWWVMWLMGSDGKSQAEF